MKLLMLTYFDPCVVRNVFRRDVDGAIEVRIIIIRKRVGIITGYY